METPAFACESLVRRYPLRLGLRHVEALRGATLSCQKGWTLALAGPNGSGKSTLLRLLAGLEPCDGGRLEVLGGSPRDRAVAARIGYAPQEPPARLDLTFRDALRLAAALRGFGTRDGRARVDELLDELGLAPHADLRVSRGSGGMARRLGLALAFLHAPELVLLDEPTAGLDADGFAALDRLLERARREGASVVVASHLPGDLTGRADELAIVLDGRVAARGAPREVLAGRDLLKLYGDLRGAHA